MKKYIFLCLSLCLGTVNAAQVIVNGGFETGDLTGWNATTNGIGGCDTDWNISTSGNTTGCRAVSSPTEGSFAAYNSFDGNGPQEFTLSQSIFVNNSLSSAILSWEETFSLEIFANQLDRFFEINLFDSTNALIANLFSESFSSGVTNSGGWLAHSLDITSALLGFQGQNVTLAFTNVIPQFFTGPAGFGLDAVSLNTEVSAVPVPAAAWLFGSGLLGLFGMRKKHRK